MSYLLAGALVAAIGVIALLAAGMIWVVRKLFYSQNNVIMHAENEGEARLWSNKQEHALEDIRAINEKLTAQLGREVAARKITEDHLALSIERLAETGDTDAVAFALRSDLKRLQSLVSKANLPEVSTGDAGGGGEDVHGAAEPGDSGDGG